MKKQNYIALLMIFFLLVSGFLPVARLNNDIISIFPVWNNTELSNGLWRWQDISFFALTFGLLLITGIYLILTNRISLLVLQGVLLIFVLLIIIIACLNLNNNISGIKDFHFSFNYYVLLIQLICSFALIAIGYKSKAKLK